MEGDPAKTTAAATATTHRMLEDSPALPSQSNDSSDIPSQPDDSLPLPSKSATATVTVKATAGTGKSASAAGVAGVTRAKPSQCTYNIALMACHRGGRPDWARTLVARMRTMAARSGDANMYPDAVSYTTTARAEAAAARGYTGAEHAGGLAAVEAMWAEVRGPLGPPPDQQCYGALIDAFVAHGALGHALAALDMAEGEPGVDPSARVYLGVMRAQAAAGDVQGVEVLARRLEGEMMARAAARTAKATARAVARRDGKAAKPLQRDERVAVETGLGAAAEARPQAAEGRGAGSRPMSNVSAAVEAEVVMCEAEARGAAGDAAGARAALERLKSLDFASSSKVLRDRSTDLLVSLFVKDIIGRPYGGQSQDEAEGRDIIGAAFAPFAAPSDATASEIAASKAMADAADAEALTAQDECEMDYINCGPEGPNAEGVAETVATRQPLPQVSDTPGGFSYLDFGSGSTSTSSADKRGEGGEGGGGKSTWGITQALDLIDSAWGFASLDEDDAFLPSLDEDDVPVPTVRGFGRLLNSAGKRAGGGAGTDADNAGAGAASASAGGTGGVNGGAPGARGQTPNPAVPTLRSAEAADALELWAGAASRLFAGDAEPLLFRGGLDPGALLREVPEVGMTMDDDEDVDFDYGSADDEDVDATDAADDDAGESESEPRTLNAKP